MLPPGDYERPKNLLRRENGDRARKHCGVCSRDGTDTGHTRVVWEMRTDAVSGRDSAKKKTGENTPTRVRF